MPPVTREQFLTAIRADPQLQMALKRPDVMAAALRIAMAAGLPVRDAELIQSPNLSTEKIFAAALPNDGLIGNNLAKNSFIEVALPEEGESIDFDGDGVPDAVRQGDRWVLRDFE